jgi:hypothetical protein
MISGRKLQTGEDDDFGEREGDVLPEVSKESSLKKMLDFEW